MYMIYNLDGIDYEVVIERKNNKHIYIRVKEDSAVISFRGSDSKKDLKNNSGHFV